MATFYRGNNYTDQNDVPVVGAQVYIYDSANALAVLTDNNDNPLAQPVLTGESGEYGYRAEEGIYREETFVGTSLRYVENRVVLGDDYLEQVEESAARAETALATMEAYLAEQAALSSINYYVDPVAGSDSNAGTQAAPFATIAAARGAADAGDVIGLRRGQTHYITAADDTGGLNFQNCEQSLIGCGTAPRPAVISAGQPLSGKTWTNEGGGVYKTTITLIGPHIPNGVIANTTYPFVRFGEDYYDWQVGGADIAANLTALAGVDGGYAINVTGETDQDIRDSSAGSTGFDLYVRLPGGADPSGLNLVTMFANSAYKFTCELLQDVELRDAWGKDTTGSTIALGNLPRLRRVRSIGAGSHGWVGPCEVWGYYAKSHPRPGMSGFTEGQAVGAGLNLFTSVDQTGVVQVHRGIECDGFNQHIYGHVSSNDTVASRIEFYPAIDAGWADNKARNCTTGVQFDPTATPPVLTQGVYFFTDIDWEVTQNLVTGAEDFVFDKGGTAAFQDTTATRQIIYNANGGRGSLDVGAVTFTSTEQNGLSFNKLIARITGTVTTPPALILRGTILPQTGDADHFYCGPDAATTNFTLTLTEGAQTGDLIENGRTEYPNSVTITHDCTFGFADQTSRANVESVLTAASKTFSIDTDTTLLRTDGTVAELPA